MTCATARRRPLPASNIVVLSDRRPSPIREQLTTSGKFWLGYAAVFIAIGLSAYLFEPLLK